MEEFGQLVGSQFSVVSSQLLDLGRVRGGLSQSFW